MPAALLYHGFGISNIQYLRTRYNNGEITFDVCHKYKRCKHCNSPGVIQRGFKFRKVRTMPIGFKTVFMNIIVRRFTCKACGYFGYEDVSHLVKPRKSYTNRFAKFIGDLYQSMTISDISKHFDLHWNTVFEIVKIRLKRSVPKVKDLRKLKYIGIDEIAIKKRHTYMTIISDHETGRVVYVKEGRRRDSISPFLKRLKRLDVDIKVVTMDMWKPYIAEVSSVLPSATIVLDKFHIVANLNKSIDLVRKQEYHNISREEQSVVKGSRYLLLKHSSNLEDNAKTRLSKLFSINKNISTAYQLKESFNHIWKYNNIDTAKSFLLNWCDDVFESKIKPLISFAKSMMKNQKMILNYFKYRMTNGKIEGINNKIKVLKRKAYGYRNNENFILFIYNLH